jgi:hypothetical protein
VIKGCEGTSIDSVAGVGLQPSIRVRNNIRIIK